MPTAVASASSDGGASAASIRRHAFATASACRSRERRFVRPAAFARPKAGTLGVRARRVERDVFATRQTRRAGRTAIHAGGAHRVEERAIGARDRGGVPHPIAVRRSRTRWLIGAADRIEVFMMLSYLRHRKRRRRSGHQSKTAHPAQHSGACFRIRRFRRAASALFATPRS